MKTCQILFAGFGGQGILFAGKFLAYKGLLAGKQEKEMAGEALETILRRGRLQETFPYLKEIKKE